MPNQWQLWFTPSVHCLYIGCVLRLRSRLGWVAEGEQGWVAEGEPGGLGLGLDSGERVGGSCRGLLHICHNSLSPGRE